MAETKWFNAFPEPRNSNPEHITKEDLLSRLKAGQKSGKDFLLVDLRRTDHEGGTISGAINLPAQTIYPSLPALLELITAAKLPEIIFWCGSSKGRGTRVAGWFADLLESRDIRTVKSLILLGGIKGWATSGPEYVERMDGYDAVAWVGT